MESAPKISPSSLDSQRRSFSSTQNEILRQQINQNFRQLYIYPDALGAPLQKLQVPVLSDTAQTLSDQTKGLSEFTKFLHQQPHPKIEIVEFDSNEIQRHTAQMHQSIGFSDSYKSELEEQIHALHDTKDPQELTNEVVINQNFSHLSQEDRDRLITQVNEMELRAVVINDEDSDQESDVVFLSASKDPFAAQFEFKPLADENDDTNEIKALSNNEPILVSVLSMQSANDLAQASRDKEDFAQLIQDTMTLAEQRKMPPPEGVTDFAPSHEAALQLSKIGRALSEDQLKAVSSTGVIKFSSGAGPLKAADLDDLMEYMATEKNNKSLFPKPDDELRKV